MLTARSQMFVWIAALAGTLLLGIVQIAATHQFRFTYLAATACVAVILAERAVRSYFKTRNRSQEESARLRGN